MSKDLLNSIINEIESSIDSVEISPDDFKCWGGFLFVRLSCQGLRNERYSL